MVDYSDNLCTCFKQTIKQTINIRRVWKTLDVTIIVRVAVLLVCAGGAF